MRILLIEDDENLQQQIKQHLESVQLCVDVASDGESGLFQGRELPYDAAIIDLGLPKIDGSSVVKTLRSEGITFPILILTARGGWQDKVEGLDAGADDYLTKPFHLQELVARINALIRRSAGKASPIITNGPFSFNTTSMQVFVNKKQITLSGHEYKVFEYLMLHIDEVISKSKIN
jgi:two-component system response regulator PhoP